MKGLFQDYTAKLQQLSQSYHTIQRALQNLDQATSNFIVNIFYFYFFKFTFKLFFKFKKKILYRYIMNAGKTLVQQAQP